MARDKTERLINLLFALGSTTRPVSREELRRWLIDQYGSDQADEAFEKMFERDKDELRSMGVPIETVTNAHDEVVGYRLRREGMSMPPLEFTAAEAAAVATASSLWSSGGMAASARRALVKLEALGEFEDPIDPGFAAHLRAPEGVFEALLAATSTRRVATFDYRRPGQDPSSRRVEPWGLVSAEAQWYLVGRDVDRDDIRVFRLGRIVGAVDASGPAGAYAIPEDVDVAALVREGRSAGQGPDRRIAVVDARPGSALALRRRAGAASDAQRFDVPFDDLHEIVTTIASLGARCVVVEPSEVQDAVRAHLRRVVT